ncbi:MAG TPA: beta-lactamase induction protein [Rudaea sp.]|nr:beta-lactamase induction protein [Rudaea sp.]
MATVFLAALLVLLVCRALPDLARLRNFSWWHRWLEHVGSAPSSIVVAGVFGPVLLCLIVQLALRGSLFGLGAFLFAAFMLFYCWGPRDLELDVEAVEKAPDSERRVAAAQSLLPEGRSGPLAFSPECLVAATFESALQRWFGVLFWFAVIGPAGALLYRLVRLLAYSSDVRAGDVRAQAVRAAAALDWLPAHLVALALALASDFDAVLKSWRDYHHAHPQGYASFEPGFLDAIARASVDADVAAEEGDAASPIVALDDAMVLVRRVLVVWLTIVALIVLAAWF